jgi:DNA-binding Lrp family transcriptional regulator
LEQLETLASIFRYKMYSLLTHKPKTGAQLARALGISRAKAHYHLKTLEKLGFVSRVDEILVNGMLEKYYLARAKFFSFDKLSEFAEENPGEVEYVQRWFRAKNEILINMLEISRENIRSTTNSSESTDNFEFDYKVRLNPEQVVEVQEALSELTKRIRQMSVKNLKQPDYDSLSTYQNIFLFLKLPNQAILHESENI